MDHDDKEIFEEKPLLIAEDDDDKDTQDEKEP